SLPPPRAVVLNSGAYVLSISFSPSGTSISFCAGNVPTPVTASFNAQLDRSGAQVTVTVPGNQKPLVMNFRVVGSQAVEGTIDGSARDARAMDLNATGKITGAAPLDTSIAVSGNIDGLVAIPGGSCSNNGHAWSLSLK